MKVILKEDIPNLGEAGQTVEVAAGYGRNFLIPRGLALLATPQNLKALESGRGLLRKKEEKRLGEARELASRLQKAICIFPMKAGEGDKLFGSVTGPDIAQKLAAQGVELDRKKINLEHPIRNLGIFTIPVRLHPQVTAELKIEVVKEGE